MKKRLISMLLLVVMVLGMPRPPLLPPAARRKPLVKSISTTVSRNSRTSHQRTHPGTDLHLFQLCGCQRKTKEIPCLLRQPQHQGRPADGGSGQSIKYMAKEKGSDPKVMGIIANGYPTPRPFGAEAGKQISRLLCDQNGAVVLSAAQLEHQQSEGQPQPDRHGIAAAQAILSAAKDIYARAQPGMRCTLP